MDILTILIGLVIGAGSAYLVLKSKFDRERGMPRQQFDDLAAELVTAKTEKARIEGEVAALEKTIKETAEALAKERLDSKALSASLATAEAELKNAHEKLENQKHEIEDLQARFVA